MPSRSLKVEETQEAAPEWVWGKKKDSTIPEKKDLIVLEGSEGFAGSTGKQWAIGLLVETRVVSAGTAGWLTSKRK